MELNLLLIVYTVMTFFKTSFCDEDFPMPSTEKYGSGYGGLDLDVLINFEQSMIKKLEKYHENASKNLEVLKDLYNRSVPDSALVSEPALNDYLATPVCAYKIIRRFVKEWDKKKVEFDEDQLALEELHHDVKKITDSLPDKKSLNTILHNVEERYGIKSTEVPKSNEL